MVHNIRQDLKECSQMCIKSHDCEYIIHKINPYQYDMEIDNPNTEYLKLSLDAVMHIIPESDDIVEYIVRRPNELTTDQQKFINGLKPRMCSPFFHGFVISAADERIEAQKTVNGGWTLNAKKSSFPEVINTVQSLLSRHLTFNFQSNISSL